MRAPPSAPSPTSVVLQLGLELLDGREAALEVVGQALDDLRLPLCDPDRFVHITQRVLDDDAVLLAAQQQADRGLVVRVPHEVVDGGQVQVDLADELGLERHGLEFDDHEAAQLEVVEEQVEGEGLVADLERDLAPDERETGPELEEELLDVVDERLLDLALASKVRRAEEVEQVRSLNACWARSESSGGRAVSKFVSAWPLRR